MHRAWRWVTVCFCVGFFYSLASSPLLADDLQWAQRSFSAPELAPEGLRNNISLDVLNALEGLMELRFQHYFSDTTSYYLQLGLGSNLFSALGFAEEYESQSYDRTQLGFELGLQHLIYGRNPRITKDERRWGSGLVLGVGLRVLYSNFTGSITNDVISTGINTVVGWQLQSRNFSVTLFLNYQLMSHISLVGNLPTDIMNLQGRSIFLQALPSIPFLNATQGSDFSAGFLYTFSQSIGIRISYSF